MHPCPRHSRAAGSSILCAVRCQGPVLALLPPRGGLYLPVTPRADSWGAVPWAAGVGAQGVALCWAQPGQGLWASPCLVLINRMDFAHFSPVLL